MSRNLATSQPKRYSRTLYGRNSTELACKVFLLGDYIKQTSNGALEILPLYFELNTENFHRVVRITEPHDPEQLKSAMDRIEREVINHPEWWRQCETK